MFKKTVVKCEECKCLLEKSDAKEVQSSFKNNVYYCAEHAPPYNRRSACGYYTDFRNVKVDEEGYIIDKEVLEKVRANPKNNSTRNTENIPSMKEVLKSLDKYEEKNHIGDKEVAKRAKLHPTTISRWRESVPNSVGKRSIRKLRKIGVLS